MPDDAEWIQTDACIISWFYTTVSAEVLDRVLAECQHNRCVGGHDLQSSSSPTGTKSFMRSKNSMGCSFQGDMTVHAYCSCLRIIIADTRPDVGDPIYDPLQSCQSRRGGRIRIKKQILSREGRFCFEYVFLFHVLFWQKSSSLVTP
jgi:hypothetical protein